MFKLKPLRHEAIPKALQKVERYRLLGEPKEAESICRDVLAIDAHSQEALVGLILALSDQFGKQFSVNTSEVRDLISKLDSEYHRTYYQGIICERQGKASLRQAAPTCKYDAYEWFVNAMDFYAQAEKIRPTDDDSALLRWNTCARIISEKGLEARPKENQEQFLE